ncbi:MAG: molybdopterin-guanine dinucleotide biosynthesis protein MobA [Rhodobacteraceae bacterium HLUCCA08]|nr:MAG: molybdopterin-guanine dinucleotide biosynthesis protein MobA [Rhodobacteraceae bacterium HLUCCA08]
MARPPAVILAGGRGRRMGGTDKALMWLGGRPMLSHVIDRLAPQAGALAINANGDPARFATFGLPVLPDPVAGFAGPLAGILAALDWALAQGAQSVVTVAADTPVFPADLVDRLAAAGAPAIAATADGPHPVFGLWPVAAAPGLRAALDAGTRKVGDWAEAIGATPVRFEDTDPPPFFNINTPEDLARAEGWA